MRTTLLILIVCLLAASCHHPSPVSNKPADSTKKDTTTTSQKIAESFPDTKMVGDTDKDEAAGEGYTERPWIDSMIADYVKHTKNKQVRFTVGHKLGETWIFDQIVKTDTAIYVSYEIGHDVTDKGGANPRYVADSWIYIDTIKRILYENNSDGPLTAWKR